MGGRRAPRPGTWQWPTSSIQGFPDSVLQLPSAEGSRIHSVPSDAGGRLRSSRNCSNRYNSRPSSPTPGSTPPWLWGMCQTHLHASLARGMSCLPSSSRFQRLLFSQVLLLYTLRHSTSFPTLILQHLLVSNHVIPSPVTHINFISTVSPLPGGTCWHFSLPS